MTYQVIIQPSVESAIDQAYLEIFDEAPLAATRWYNGLVEAIGSLEAFPQRCAIAPENEHFEPEIRQLLYGRSRRKYRVLFTILDDTVQVLHFRHWAQETLDNRGLA